MTIPANQVPPLKPKYENLRQTVQGFKLVKLKFNQAEIALIAGVSRGTAHNQVEKIQSFWSEDSPTPDDDKKFILERSIEIGLKEALSDQEPTLEHIFGVILGTYLKVETDLLDESESLRTVWTIGRHITKIYKQVCSRKDGEGVPIHSENQSAKYLRQLNSVDKLFLRSDNYTPGGQSKRWSPSEILREYVGISNHELLEVISTKRDALKSMFSSLYMSPSGDTKSVFFTVHNYYIYTMLDIDMGILKQFEINSVFSLLMEVVKFTDGEIHIPVKHKAKGQEYLGRTYNVFTSLRSHERLKLGYIGYDMSAAMQSISLQLITATKDDYPMLWDYTHDKAYKKRIRTEIAQALDIEEDEVKAKLTAFANGSIVGKNKHPHYEAFQVESDKLRRSVLKHVSENEPKVLARATEQSRRELPEELDWSDTERQETPEEMRNTSSVYFFVWTWYERQIRQAMLDILEDGVEVHDAVYSKMDIDPKIVEQEIYDQTGFTITIEQEK